MRILTVLFYAGFIIFIGLVMIAFTFAVSLDLLQPQDIANIIVSLQNSLSSKVIVSVSGLLLIIISFSFAQLILGRFQREKTIAFDTASGQVTIALTAVEDLIRRLAGIIPEIKELRPDVIATKKGIIVDLRVVLKAEANIPELTGRLQDITRSKIQEVLGLEEEIIIRIHVAKISPVEEKERRDRDPRKDESNIPYARYGRT